MNDLHCRGLILVLHILVPQNGMKPSLHSKRQKFSQHGKIITYISLLNNLNKGIEVKISNFSSRL